MKVELVMALAEDAEALTAIQRSAFKPLYEIYQDEESPFLEDETKILKWISLPNISYFKIYVDKELYGGIVYIDMGNNEYYLIRLFIKLSEQCKGIGTLAILEVEKHFPNAKKFVLDFPIGQLKNQKCYEKAGYIDTGKRDKITDNLILAIYEKNI